MTVDDSGENVPFLVRRSEEIKRGQLRRLRYDAVRQIAMVEVDGRWVDGPDALGDAPGTRVTRVEAETTDDE